jgi:hypothetical protein
MKTKLEAIATELELTEVYVDGMTFDEFVDALTDNIHEQEIIYYHKAIKYLLENDASLNESIAMASEMGYDIDSVNSELLATLHYQNYLRDEWSSIADEVEQLFED